MKTKNYIFKLILGTCALATVNKISGCKKLVEVDAPVTSTNAAIVYNDNTTAAAVLTGIYMDLSKSNLNSSANIPSLPYYTGLSSDELSLYIQGNLTIAAYYNNNLDAGLGDDQHFWNNIYPKIFVANSAIEGLIVSETLTQSLKEQLLGEAKFMRAFFYFYLVNLYGDVPLALSTDYKVNSQLTRVSKDKVYEQIIIDLKDAQNMLKTEYLGADILTPSTERVRPNKFAATALLARVYLYIKDYANAELQATALIDNAAIYKLSPLNEVFLKESSEAIWQLYPVGTNRNANTAEGRFFILPSTGPGVSYPVYLSERIVNSFEKGDQRKQEWVNNVTVAGQVYNYPYKYKIANVISDSKEYSVVLRLAEQYLIRAESRILQNNIVGGVADLNTLRTRATDLNAIQSEQLTQLPTTLSKSDATLAVEHERQVELFAEAGHRWLDLKRTNRANTILASIKSTYWQFTDQLYPIPQTDINRNPNLVGHQNPGY